MDQLAWAGRRRRKRQLRRHARHRKRVRAHHRLAMCQSRVRDAVETLCRRVQHRDDADRCTSSYDGVGGGEWQCGTQVHCPVHDNHILSVVYVRNPRDVDLMVYYQDGTRRWYTIL